MRFLLNKASAAASKSGKRLPSQPIVNGVINTNPFFSDNTTSNRGEKETVQAWGQQCSPNCGCALRFKADIDPENKNRIIIATYHAKTIITTVSKSVSGRTILQPLLTQSGGTGGKGRPMLKECSCNTLHVLAKSITEELPKLTLSQAQNQLQFSGVRSSTAFRYSVLKKYNLLSKEDKMINNKIHHGQEGKCFDLVEEALVACLKGYTPRPRPSNNQRNDTNQYHKSLPRETEEQGQSYRSISHSSDVNPLRFVQAAKKRAENVSYSNAELSRYNHHENFSQMSSMPPFHFTNEIHSTRDKLMENYSIYHPLHNTNGGSSIPIPDWVSYVDEERGM